MEACEATFQEIDDVVGLEYLRVESTVCIASTPSEPSLLESQCRVYMVQVVLRKDVSGTVGVK